YILQDEEIDFDKVVKEEEIPVPRAVSWTAHWLAIEGVQPLIPENPSPAATTSTAQSSKPRSNQPQANGTSAQGGQTQPLATNKTPLSTKSHLSRELQQYYARLTDSLLPGTSESGSDRALDRKRTAALSSLRNDAGLQGILPYLVKWVGDSVVGALAVRSSPEDDMGDMEEDVDRRVLEVMLMVIHAILDNQRLFVEPYLHMLLPPLLSVLLTSTLSSTSSYSSLDSHPPPTPRTLRTQAASLVAHLLKLHAPSYPSLPPRITKTLLVALLDDGSAIRPGSTPDAEAAKKPLSLGTKDGAIRGLVGVGREAVHRGLIAGQAAKLVGDEVERRVGRGENESMMDLSGLNEGGGEGEWAEEVRDVVNACLEAFATIHPFPAGPAEGNFASFMSRPNAAQVNEARDQLVGCIGPFFAMRVCQKNSQWAVGLAKALADHAVAAGGTPGGTGGLASNLDNLALDPRRDTAAAAMDVVPPGESFALLDDQHAAEMGIPMGMGGDLGPLGGEAMDAT
ncbi:hypothetical protein FRC01_012555, partial [Tulasnella sp. 417]